jgi:hypothetical protein
MVDIWLSGLVLCWCLCQRIEKCLNFLTRVNFGSEVCKTNLDKKPEDGTTYGEYFLNIARHGYNPVVGCQLS